MALTCDKCSFEAIIALVTSIVRLPLNHDFIESFYCLEHAPKALMAKAENIENRWKLKRELFELKHDNPPSL